MPGPRFLPPLLVLSAALVGLVPAAWGQGLRVDVFNTRRTILTGLWGSGNWAAFCTEEYNRDLNGDRYTDDSILCTLDLRTLAVQVTGVAVDPLLSDNTDDWPVAFSPEYLAFQVAEDDQGGRDLNGNGKAEDNVLAVYQLSNRQVTNLGIVGQQPTFGAGKLYFTQPEAAAGKDLNGDGDARDQVLCVWDPATRKVESLVMDAEGGFSLAGDWIAALTSEAAQGGADLNGDRDTADLVAQMYQISTRKWTTTGLESSAEYVLTPRLLVTATDEVKQGRRDLNGNTRPQDIVAQVWDLAAGKAINTGLECSGGIAADGVVVGVCVQESAGGVDLNGDRDTKDGVAHAFTLGAAKPVNLRADASGGIAATGGRVMISCSEQEQAGADLNGDGDHNDYVLVSYDPAANRMTGLKVAVDGDLHAAEGRLAWKCLESDQANRDLNRDGDTDDSVLFVLDAATGALSATGLAVTDSIVVTARAVVCGVLESDQANRDLNMNGDAEDEVVHVARFPAR